MIKMSGEVVMSSDELCDIKKRARKAQQFASRCYTGGDGDGLLEKAIKYMSAIENWAYQYEMALKEKGK